MLMITIATSKILAMRNNTFYQNLQQANLLMPKIYFSLISFKDLPVQKNYKVFPFRLYNLWSDWASYKYLQCADQNSLFFLAGEFHAVFFQHC